MGRTGIGLLKFIFIILTTFFINLIIQLLESPIPATTAVSQKASSDDISGTKRGTIGLLVSKRPEKILNKKIKKIKKNTEKMVKNGQNGQNGLK